MRQWWQRRSLRLRLTVWYAITSAVILLALGSILLVVLYQRLISEVDRQLRVDFETIESRVTSDSEGDLSWPGYGHTEDQDEPGRPDEPGPWFEILSSQGEVLLREGPSADWNLVPLSTFSREQPRLFSTEAKRQFYVRVLEGKAHIEGQTVLLRVFKPETDLRRAILELGAVLGLGLPLAAVLSATGGYLIANRSLLPVSQMAARAQQITAESLGGRLPIANPHDELGKLALVFNSTLSRLDWRALFRNFAVLQPMLPTNCEHH
jgi:HAMP domain-containing protein